MADTYGRMERVIEIGVCEKLLYALPVLGTAFLMGSLTILQGIYAKYFGLSLTTIASVLLISRLFDTLTDPLIGYWSDRYCASGGGRKPFVIAGGVLLIISSYFLYIPPANVDAVYFLGWFLVFYLAFTLFEIPHLAWGGELSANSQEKNKVFGWRAASAFMGALLFFAMPLLPIFETNAFTPETMKWSVLAAGLLLLPMLYTCIKKVPDGGVEHVSIQSNVAGAEKENFRVLLLSIISNVPFLWFLAAFFFVGTGIGMWFTLVFLFVENFLGLGQKFAVVYVISFSVSILTLSVWSKLADYWGKQVVWSIAMLIIVIGLICTGMLTPEDASELPLLLCMCVIYSGFAAVTVMAPSLLADIIDYGTWKFDRDRAGTYFSLYTLVTKANLAIGGALGLGIAGWYGFDATAVDHSVDAVFGLRLAISWLPALLVLLSIIFILLIPINARRHAVIRRCLDSRTRRIRYGQTLKPASCSNIHIATKEILNAR